jgi:hypothetical protein
MRKQVIELKKLDGFYKVKSLVNRLEPEVGTILEDAEAQDLVAEANRLSSVLTVKVS